SFVSRVTETHFPVPRLEVVARLSHFAPQPNIEQITVVGEFFVSRTGVVHTANPHSCRHRETAPVGKKIWDSRVGDREGIKRIRDWHADADGTQGCVSVWDLEWIGRKRHCRHRRIEK